MWQNVNPNSFHLTTNQVHVWKANVNEFKKHSNFFASLLSNDEALRASKFRFEKDYFVYITAKGLLRILLAKYTNVPANSIEFSYNSQGKPSLKSSTIQFNISHSESYVLLGFTLNHTIGVDIEYNKRTVEVEKIAPRFFSKSETQQLFTQDPKMWLNLFYTCWTRKEAFIKAKGGGLSIPLDQFIVSILPNDVPTLKEVLWDTKDVKNWKMKTFEEDHYTGAIIVHSPDAQFFYFNCDESLLKNE